MNTASPEIAALTPVADAVTTQVGAQPATAIVSAEVQAGVQQATKRTSANDFLDPEDEVLSPETAAQLEQVFGKPATEGDSEAESETSAEGADEGLQDEGDDEGATEDLDIEEDSSAVVWLFKKKCLGCSALVPWADNLHRKCHFSNGNEHCPAQSMKIMTRIPLENIVPRFMSAEEQNDTARLQKLWAQVNEWEPWAQNVVHEAIKAERTKRALKAGA